MKPSSRSSDEPQFLHVFIDSPARDPSTLLSHCDTQQDPDRRLREELLGGAAGRLVTGLAVPGACDYMSADVGKMKQELSAARFTSGEEATSLARAEDDRRREPTPPGRPLLTIAIPTWNRAGLLEELLTVLAPQLEQLPIGEVELLVSDNGSTDETSGVIQRFAESGLRLRYHRHPENVGSDANFISAFEMAQGTYFWLFSDDDILVPGGLDGVLTHLRRGEFDFVYATSYSFRSDWSAERQQDPMRRRFHIITSPSQVARVFNVMFTFISGIIVNKARFEELRRTDMTIEAPLAFLGTNLTQLSWTLPLLRQHRRSLVLWERLVAGRVGNGGGYSIGHVFGEKLTGVMARCLPDRRDLANIITSYTLRRWFPSQLFEIRTSDNRTFALDQAEAVLRHTFGSNLRFWIFTWPMLRLPLPLAKLWLQAGTAVSKLIYMFEVPTFWRRQTREG